MSDAGARAAQVLLAELAELGIEPEEFIRTRDLDEEAAAYLRVVARGWRQDSRVRVGVWGRYVVPVAHTSTMTVDDVEEQAREAWESADEMVRASWRVASEVQEIERIKDAWDTRT